MNLLLFRGPDGGILPVLERVPMPERLSETELNRWSRLRQSILDAYQKLRERLDHQERLCSNLRHANSLEVWHSSRTSSEDARNGLRKFLQGGYRKHSRWLTIDIILAAFGATLVWVPGPNIFFFYPAARALSHWLARNGASRGLKLPTSWQVDERMTEVEAKLDRPSEIMQILLELEQSHNLEILQEQIKALVKL